MKNFSEYQKLVAEYTAAVQAAQMAWERAMRAVDEDPAAALAALEESKDAASRRDEIEKRLDELTSIAKQAGA